MVMMRFFLLLLLAFSGSAMAAFVPPAEGPVPFRRDKLPVDVDTMTKLSRQLVVLAGQVSMNKPEDRRAVAQLLALSLALDPSNNQVRDLVQQVAEGGEVPRAEGRDVKLARARAWDLLGWLEQPEAGDDGKALGACLSDVLIKADPGHPSAKIRVEKGERGIWTDWVAAEDRFRETDSPSVVEVDADDSETMNEPDPDASGEAAKILLEEVKYSMPVRCSEDESEVVETRLVELTLKAWVEEEAEKRFILQLPGEDSDSSRTRSYDELYEFLESRHGRLPKGLMMSLSLPDGLSMSLDREGKALSGLLVVMANAVFSGIPPEGNIFAAVGDEGVLEGPDHFWETLRILSEADDDSEDGGRLVLPSAMRQYLPPLLTLGESDFFFRYEVLLAENIDELLTMSSSQPMEGMLSAINGFAMVKEAKGTRSLGSFVSHSSTQQRLGQIVNAFPQHASARMLALRGTSSWPKRLDRKVYAMELRSALRPMGKVLSSRWDEMKLGALSVAEDECRKRLAEIEKLYESVSDRTELHDPAYNAAKSLAGLVAELKRISDDDRHKMPSRVRATYLEYVDTVKMLTAAAGDAEGYKLPDRERSR